MCDKAWGDWKRARACDVMAAVLLVCEHGGMFTLQSLNDKCDKLFSPQCEYITIGQVRHALRMLDKRGKLAVNPWSRGHFKQYLYGLLSEERQAVNEVIASEEKT